MAGESRVILRSPNVLSLSCAARARVPKSPRRWGSAEALQRRTASRAAPASALGAEFAREVSYRVVDSGNRIVRAR